jgi:hypothetical protein
MAQIKDFYSLKQLGLKKDYLALETGDGYVESIGESPIAGIHTGSDVRFIALLTFKKDTPRGFHYHLRKTHQANFWKSGEDWDPSSLSVNVVFDGNRPVEPFVFWANGSLQNVYDAAGERLGSYLWATMNISVSVAGLDVGDHMMTVSIETPNGEIFSQSWDFVIRQRETPRRTTPIELFPTAEHLAQFPHPTPEYIMRVSNEATGLDRFSPIGSGEGLCLALTDAPFVSASTAENPFRPSAWDAITLSFDNVALDGDRVGIQANDTVGHRFVCGDTDALASGTHMATITIEVDAIEYVYSWAFVVP